MKVLTCKTCQQKVFIDIKWYGLGRIFRFNCNCKKLEPFNGQGSYVEALEYAKRQIPEWVDSKENK